MSAHAQFLHAATTLTGVLAFAVVLGQGDMEASVKLALSYDDQCSEGAGACTLSALQLHKRQALVPAPAEAPGQSSVRDLASTANDTAEPAEWDPQQVVLLRPSTAKTFTYYMYRAMANESYPPDNTNTANLQGVMWYIQNEIVSGKWGSTNRFGVSVIKRYLVTTRATQPLADKNMNFGLRVAFDSGKCTNAACEYNWWRYGFNVGCNKLGEYPFPMFQTNYPGGVWYSLPGKCPYVRWNEHNATCDAEQPGGHCYNPTGAGNCTWSFSNAGFISLSELYAAEAVSLQSFWAGNTIDENMKKVQVAAELFARKYPGTPRDEDMSAPPCDFNKTEYFKCEFCK